VRAAATRRRIESHGVDKRGLEVGDFRRLKRRPGGRDVTLARGIANEKVWEWAHTIGKGGRSFICPQIPGVKGKMGWPWQVHDYS